MSYWLYRTYDERGNLLYVGITRQGMLRLAEHQRRGSRWVSSFARIEIERYDSEEEAAEAERHVIADEKPRDNITWTRPGKANLRVPHGFPAWDLIDEEVRRHAVEYMDDQREAA